MGGFKMYREVLICGQLINENTFYYILLKIETVLIKYIKNIYKNEYS